MQKRKAPQESTDSVPVTGHSCQEDLSKVGAGSSCSSSSNGKDNDTEPQGRGRELSRADCLGLFNQGKYSGDAACFFECVEGCKGLLRKYPVDADIRRLCARSNVQLGMLCEEDAQAATFFRKAIAADPSLADAHSNLGLRIRDQDEAAAEHHFREAIRLAAAVLASHQRADGNQDGDAESQEEEEEDEEEEVSSFEQEELDAGRVAQYNLALLLSQLGGRDSEADAHCRALSFNYRLSPEVLAHARWRKHRDQQQQRGDRGTSASSSQQTSGAPDAPPAPAPAPSAKNGSDKHFFVRTHESAARPALLRQLQRNFAPAASFWDEHGYHEEPGFFSYNYQLSKPPTNAVELLIQSLRPVLEKDLANGLCSHSSERSRCTQSSSGSSPPPPPTSQGSSTADDRKSSVPEIVSAEWWVHSRAHGSGHQLHYDMDETRLRTSGGKDRGHPLVSTILYLSQGAAPEEQPTLVTRQRFAGAGGFASMKKSSRVAAANKDSQYEHTGGWLVYPRENRLCFFDGELLHGVVPGTPGAARKLASASGAVHPEAAADHPEHKRARHQSRSSEETNLEHSTGAPPQQSPSPCGGLRTTLMIGWWVRDPVKTPAGQLGPNMVDPLPVPVFDDDAAENDGGDGGGDTTADDDDDGLNADSEMSTAVPSQERGDVGCEDAEKGEVEQEEHSDPEELNDFAFRTRPPQWPNQLAPTDEVWQEFKATPAPPPHGAHGGDVSLSSVPACMDVSRVWRSLRATTSADEVRSETQDVPVFPATNGVMFFGRLFLQSLSQVDEEIMAGYEDDAGDAQSQ